MIDLTRLALSVFLVLMVLSLISGKSRRRDCDETIFGYICDFQDSCGKSSSRATPSRYIINGNDVQLGEFPFVAQVYNANAGNLCFGVIVSDFHIVTNVHCIDGTDEKLKGISVRVGTINNWTHEMDEDTENIYSVEADSACERENRARLSGIVLLKIKNQLTFNETVQPACWPADVHKMITRGNGSECYQISGGFTREQEDADDYPMSERLQKFRTETLECPREPMPIAEGDDLIRTKCMKSVPRGSAPCHYDTGGPTLCRNKTDSRWELLGVLSDYPWHTRCLLDRVHFLSIVDEDLAATTKAECAPPPDDQESES